MERAPSVATIDFAVQVPSIVFSIERAVHWAEQFGLEVVGNGTNPSDDIAGGEKAMTEILGSFPDIAGDHRLQRSVRDRGGGSRARAGQTDLVFGGQNGGSDAFEAIRAGRLSYTAKLDPPSMGKFAALGALQPAPGQRGAEDRQGRGAGDRDVRQRRLGRPDLGRAARGGVRADRVASSTRGAACRHARAPRAWPRLV